MSVTTFQLGLAGHFPTSGLTCIRVAFHNTTCVRQVTWTNRENTGTIVMPDKEMKGWSGWIQISVYQVLHLDQCTLIDRGWSMTGFEQANSKSCRVDLQDPFQSQLHMKHQLTITLTKPKRQRTPVIDWVAFDKKMKQLNYVNPDLNLDPQALWSIPIIANRKCYTIPLPVFTHQQKTICQNPGTKAFLACLIPRCIALACLLLGIRCPENEETLVEWSEKDCRAIMSILAAVCMEAWPYAPDLDGDCVETDTWTNPMDVPTTRLGVMTWDCEDGGIMHGVISQYVATEYKNSNCAYASRLSKATNDAGLAGILIAKVHDRQYGGGQDQEPCLHAAPVRFKNTSASSFAISVEESTAVVCSKQFGGNQLEGGAVNWVDGPVLDSPFYDEMLYVVCEQSKRMFRCCPPDEKQKCNQLDLETVWECHSGVDTDFVRLLTRPHVPPHIPEGWKRKTPLFVKMIADIQAQFSADTRWRIVHDDDNQGLEMWPNRFIRLEAK